MTTEKAKTGLKVTVPILALLFSIIFLYGWVANSGRMESYKASVEDSKSSVLKLSAASVAVSTAITLLPGDTASPTATELMDLAEPILLVITALYLEQFILNISVPLVFKFLIPAICLLFIGYNLSKRPIFQSLLVKTTVLTLCILFVVPTSIEMSNLVKDSYSQKLESTIESAEVGESSIHAAVDNSNENETDENIIQSVISFFKDAGQIVSSGVKGLSDKFVEIFDQFVESVAVFIITSCVIPLLVLLFFAWLIKAIFNYDIQSKYIAKRQNIHAKLREYDEYSEDED